MASKAGLDFSRSRCQTALVNNDRHRGTYIKCCIYLAHQAGDPPCDLQPLTSAEFAAWCAAAGWPNTKHVNPAPLPN